MMDEDALRLMVREAIAKHLAPPHSDADGADRGGQQTLAVHASHVRYSLPGSGGACLIEPTVQCNHCGYCQSHGH